MNKQANILGEVGLTAKGAVVQLRVVQLGAYRWLEPRWQVGWQSLWQEEKKVGRAGFKERHLVQSLVFWILSYFVVIILNSLRKRKRKFLSENVLKLKSWLNWVYFINSNSLVLRLSFMKSPTEKKKTPPAVGMRASHPLLSWTRAPLLTGNPSEAESESCRTDHWLYFSLGLLATFQPWAVGRISALAHS